MTLDYVALYYFLDKLDVCNKGLDFCKWMDSKELKVDSCNVFIIVIFKVQCFLYLPKLFI